MPIPAFHAFHMKVGLRAVSQRTQPPQNGVTILTVTILTGIDRDLYNILRDIRLKELAVYLTACDPSCPAWVRFPAFFILPTSRSQKHA